MPAITVIRALVITEIVLILASVLSARLPTHTPPAVDEYLSGPGAGPLFHLITAEPTALTYVVAAVLAGFVAIYITALVGLLCLRPWARRLYVLSFLYAVCLSPFMGYTLAHPVGESVDRLATACSGALLAALFLSDARALFGRRTPDKTLERTREE